MKGHLQQASIFLMIGAIILFIGCNRRNVSPEYVPKNLIGGRTLYLGQSWDDLRNKYDVGKSEVDDSYDEYLNNSLFDKSTYLVASGEVQDITLSNYQADSSKIDSVMKICVSTYGYDSRGSLNVHVTDGLNILRAWKLRNDIVASLIYYRYPPIPPPDQSKTYALVFRIGSDSESEWDSLEPWDSILLKLRSMRGSTVMP